MANYCATTIGKVDADTSNFAGIFNSAVTGVSATVACVSVIFYVVRASILFWRGTHVSRIYLGSVVFSLCLQIYSYITMWGFRIWCPGAVNESFCRSGIFQSSVAETAASFAVLYVVSDRLSGMFPRPELSVSVGARPGGLIPPPLMPPDNVWRACMAVFLFWGSSVVSGLPVIISSTVRARSGLVPMCGIWGYDGVAHIIFHTTIVYVMPVALILTKNAGAQKFPGMDEHWPLMRRALIFYAIHFVLTLPMMVAKSIDYMFKGAPFSSAVGYYELVATILYLFRLLNFVSILDVFERDESRSKTRGERDCEIGGAGDGDFRKGAGCAVRCYCCRRRLAWFGLRWFYGFVIGVLTRLVGRVKSFFRGTRGRGKDGVRDDEKKGKGLPARDELSVSAMEDVDAADNKKGIENPNYVDSDNDSGYAVEAISASEDRVFERNEGEWNDDDEEEKRGARPWSGERGRFVGETAMDIEDRQDCRLPATQDGVILYASTASLPGETVV